MLAFVRPLIWSTLPLFGSGTKSRIKAPAMMPRGGDTLWNKTKINQISPHRAAHAGCDHTSTVWGEPCEELEHEDKEVCVYSLKTRPLFADTPDILYTLITTKNIPAAHSVGTVCAHVWAWARRAHVQEAKSFLTSEAAL